MDLSLFKARCLTKQAVSSVYNLFQRRGPKLRRVNLVFAFLQKYQYDLLDLVAEILPGEYYMHVGGRSYYGPEIEDKLEDSQMRKYSSTYRDSQRKCTAYIIHQLVSQQE